MSKNIVIQEGGQGKQLTVNKLKTDLVGGGTCLWVPEDETVLGTKMITENGTYKASDDGYYGYSEVTVSGVGSVTGKDPDTGEDVTVTRDPGTGEIVTTILPTEIRVITPPAKTDYVDGETIDYSGIVVHAYSSKGTDLGPVPFNELVFPVTVADASGEMIAESDIVQGSVPCTTFLTCTRRWEAAHVEQTFTYTEGTFAVISSYKTDFLFASANPNAECLERIRAVPIDEQGHSYEENNHKQVTQQYTYNNKTVYYTEWGQMWTYDEISIDNAPALNGPVAWTMIYGEITEAFQSLPVQWPNTPDGAVLETSFNITVG